MKLKDILIEVGEPENPKKFAGVRRAFKSIVQDIPISQVSNLPAIPALNPLPIVGNTIDRRTFINRMVTMLNLTKIDPTSLFKLMTGSIAKQAVKYAIEKVQEKHDWLEDWKSEMEWALEEDLGRQGVEDEDDVWHWADTAIDGCCSDVMDLLNQIPEEFQEVCGEISSEIVEQLANTLIEDMKTW